MRILAAAVLAALAAGPAAAQAPTRATTEDGRKVLLYPDGRWKYAPAGSPAPGAGKVHARAPAATEKVDLLRGGMALFIDPSKWKQTPSEDPTKISFRHSFDVGSVRLTERHVHTDPPSEAELTAIDAMLRETFKAVPSAAGTARMVGVAGTATTIAAVANHVTPYDPALIHGSTVTADQVESTLSRLASLPTHLRKTVPGLQPKRADVIVAGALVLRAAMRAVGVKEILISDRGLRWGLLADRFGAKT